MNTSGASNPGDQPVDRGNVAEAGHVLRRNFYSRRSGRRREEEARLSAVVALAGVVVTFAYPAATCGGPRRLIGRIEQRLLDLGSVVARSARACRGKVERRREVRRCLLAIRGGERLRLELAVLLLRCGGGGCGCCCCFCLRQAVVPNAIGWCRSEKRHSCRGERRRRKRFRQDQRRERQELEPKGLRTHR